MTCRWSDCWCRSWPPVRRVMSTGELYRIEAAPYVGEPWLYFYAYVGMGERRGPVLELFAGTAPVCKAARSRGLEATAVDLDDYRPPLFREPPA